MRQTTGIRKSAGEKLVKDIKRATRKLIFSQVSASLDLDEMHIGNQNGVACRDRNDEFFFQIRPNAAPKEHCQRTTEPNRKARRKDPYPKPVQNQRYEARRSVAHNQQAKRKCWRVNPAKKVFRQWQLH